MKALSELDISPAPWGFDGRSLCDAIGTCIPTSGGGFNLYADGDMASAAPTMYDELYNAREFLVWIRDNADMRPKMVGRINERIAAIENALAKASGEGAE